MSATDRSRLQASLGGLAALVLAIGAAAYWAAAASDVAASCVEPVATTTGTGRMCSSRALTSTVGSPAPPPGQISGTVRSGTADAGLDYTGATTVMVLPLSEAAAGTPVSTTVAPDGAFGFADLEVGSGASYGLVASYRGVDYIHTEIITLTAQSPVVGPVELLVYEPDNRLPLAVRTAHVVVAASPEEAVLQVTEVWVIENSSDRTRISDGPEGILSLTLPRGARSVSLRDPRDQARSTMSDGTVVIREPVPPGEREIAVGYEVPYRGTDVQLEWIMPLPVEQLRVMAIGPEVRVQSPALPETERSELGGRAVSTALGRELRAETAVGVLLSGLPEPAPVQSGLSAGGPTGAAEFAPLLEAVVIALASVGVAIALLYPGLDRKSIRRRMAARAETEWQHIVGELARLERGHAPARVDEDQYRERRAQLMDRAIKLSRVLRCDRSGTGSARSQESRAVAKPPEEPPKD